MESYDLFDGNQESEYFDVGNATYSIDCVSDFGFENKLPITFREGEWKSENQADSDGLRARVWISEFFITELVKGSPGNEVIAEFHCHDGASYSSSEVQVFDGKSGKQLGSGLTESIEYLNAYETGGEIGVKSREWRKGDLQCCPSSYVVTAWRWESNDWEKVLE